jgi:AAA+ ATPase superfamily predicted ATPase
MPDRPVNPFIIGAPASASRFIGRREQVNTILSQLANPESRGSSAISGERRIGKTSLLHYIISPEAAAKYGLSHSQFTFVSVDTQTLGSYMDSQNLDTFSETVFWHYILRLLSIYQTPSAEYSKELLEQERVGVHDLIPLFAQVAAQGKLVVLLLDEFEWIINNINPQRPTLLHALRSLINRPISERGLALITSSEKPLNVLCSHIKFMGSPMPNALVPVHLRPFSTAEAYELIDEYLEVTAFTFNDEDKDLAYDLSEGHPYWLQRACFEMFNRYIEKAEGNSLQGTQITIILDALDYEEIKTEIMVERGRASTAYIKRGEVQPSPKIDLPPTPRKFTIFVSSTSLDLQREHQAVEKALHRMCTASFSGMEYLGSRPETPKEVCLEKVSRADVYVGIFAHRYGDIDSESDLSMTELEYRKARECDIPCLIYMIDESVPVLPAHIEQEPKAMAKLKTLRQDLLSKHAVSFFTNPDSLAMQVVADLSKLCKEPTKSERLSLPPNYQLAHLIRTRHETNAQPYLLLLGSSLSLTPEVRRAVCESDDWEAFWTTMQRRSTAECRALMASPLAGLNLAPGYRCLAELAQAGYFNIILTANIDDALDNALRILPPSKCKVLCYGQTSAQEITTALSQTVPRIKATKLRGDVNAYKLPLTPGGQFEFPAELEEAVERLLSQDTVLVGDIPYDTDIQRCIRRGDGALWVVVPEEPQPGSFLYNAKQARPKGEVITGPGAEFGPFFRALVEALGLH